MLALLLALQGAVSPQTSDSLLQITLREALQRAAQLDPSYVAALGQVDNAVWARRNAFAVFVLPSVTMNVNQQHTDPAGFFFTDSLLRLKTTWSAQLNARYDLFTRGQKVAGLPPAGGALEGAHADEPRQRLSTALPDEAGHYA